MGEDKHGPHRFELSMRSMVILVTINLTLLLGMAVPLLYGRFASTTSLPTELSSPVLSPTVTLTPSPGSPASAFPAQTGTPVQVALPVEHPGPLAQGFWVLSLTENGYAHLFAYQPQSLPLTRLTNYPWDEISPALSPDGSRVAFSARQNGYWDLFVLDLASGDTTRLTDSGDYDGNPTWSPDGLWLAYETYYQNHSQIAVISVEDPTRAPIFVTAGLELNRSPAWSSRGREIAFISDQDGANTLWIADLDKVEQRLFQVARSTRTRFEHPAFSPDGKQLAWASIAEGSATIMVWDSQQPTSPPRALGSGDWPVWSPDGSLVAARLTQPNQTFLAVYQGQTGNMVLPPEPFPGSILGLDWCGEVFPASLDGPLLQARNATPAPFWDGPGPYTGQPSLVALGDVTAPNPALSDRADDSFQAMRQHLSAEIGWDFLANLENAFVPLTSPLSPGLAEDWLYTGRGIAANALPLNAGWMAVVREDYGSQTYWRLYLKTRYQDGSQGMPLRAAAVGLECPV